MNMQFPYFPPQPKSGWICPKCGNVYSPDWPTCSPCNQRNSGASGLTKQPGDGK